MKRRQLISALGIGGSAGCLSSFSPHRFSDFRLYTYTTSQVPSDATPAPYPKEGYTNEFITKAIKKAIEKSPNPIDNGETAVVEIPKRDIESVKSAFRSIPDSAGSESQIAGFLGYDQHIVAIRLVELQ